MHPLMSSTFVQQHIEELYREAARGRLGRKSRRQKSDRRKATAVWLQRAPAS